jgi:hypothetical protein
MPAPNATRGPRVARRLAAALVACLVAGLPAGAPGAFAEAAAVSIQPSLLPDRLGASTAFTLSFRFTGGEEGIPPPLRQVTVRLPAGLRIVVTGAKVCQPARLKRKGPAGCPAKSQVGSGHARLEVHAGSQAVPEQATIWAFRGPNRGGQPSFLIFGQGYTPLDQSALSTEVLETDKPPYGWRTVTTVPPIPTVMYEPNASFLTFSLTFGAGAPRAHAAAGKIVIPGSCPAGGFPFATEVAFADGTGAQASATVPCP